MYRTTTWLVYSLTKVVGPEYSLDWAGKQVRQGEAGEQAQVILWRETLRRCDD